jgi:hypothetical protein
MILGLLWPKNGALGSYCPAANTPILDESVGYTDALKFYGTQTPHAVNM